MTNINLQNIDDGLVAELKVRAAARNVTMEEEARTVLVDAVVGDAQRARVVAVDLISEKVQRLNAALERNWIVQLTVATVGLAIAFDVGNIGAALADYLSLDESRLGPISIALSAIYFYYFMRFGYLLIRFIPTRTAYDNIVNQMLAAPIATDDLQPLLNTSSYFETFYSPDPSHRATDFGYFLFTIAVASAAQASALYLPIKAYGLNGGVGVALGFYLVGLGFLYSAFWRMLESHPNTKIVVVGCIVATVLWVAAFYVVAGLT